jgi:hypothetical protein
MGQRRTYIVSVYEDDPAVIVESVQLDARARLTALEDVPRRIREWEREGKAPGPAAEDLSPGRS